MLKDLHCFLRNVLSSLFLTKYTKTTGVLGQILLLVCRYGLKTGDIQADAIQNGFITR